MARWEQGVIVCFCAGPLTPRHGGPSMLDQGIPLSSRFCLRRGGDFRCAKYAGTTLISSQARLVTEPLPLRSSPPRLISSRQGRHPLRFILVTSILSDSLRRPHEGFHGRSGLPGLSLSGGGRALRGTIDLPVKKGQPAALSRLEFLLQPPGRCARPLAWPFVAAWTCAACAWRRLAPPFCSREASHRCATHSNANRASLASCCSRTGIGIGRRSGRGTRWCSA
mmetsp:Transcript_4624/g.18426  ORF Transcript_4624/g.18426 Transcript_4624/m.18426 type:complete len:224 (+) Transcript_4624:1287-1958(+)